MNNRNLHILFLSAVAALTACNESTVGLHPNSALNPWVDNYSHVASYENRNAWGTYNVHDPIVRKFGDTYYAYSTDAIWFPPVDTTKPRSNEKPEIGNIQMRKSKDLVHWDFCGWAFKNIPTDAWNWVYPISKEKTSRGLWAPFVLEHNGIYRLYYCLSTFGQKVSYIGLAEATTPLGPWEAKGCVVKTDASSVMNAIDPTVIDDQETGRQWMVYGSFFGGLFALELDKETGLAKTEGDQGHLVAHRANYQRDNMEAPEVIYNPTTKKYYMFVSYGPLATTYNVRVSIADKPEGPYADYFGTNPAGEVNTLPMLTAPYQFEGHCGWAGLGHCTVFEDGKGNYFLASQGRLGSNIGMMDFHIRQLFFNSKGWPVVSPERYAGEENRKFAKNDLYGTWEIIRLKDKEAERELRDGQVIGGLMDEEINKSTKMKFFSKNIVDFKDNEFTLCLENEKIRNVVSFFGHDWELQTSTILFSGIDNEGYAVWGKKIE